MQYVLFVLLLFIYFGIKMVTYYVKWKGRSMTENSYGLKPYGEMFTKTVITIEKYEGVCVVCVCIYI